METDRLTERYASLQKYVGWTPEDAGRVRGLKSIVAPHLPALIDDFYHEIEQHPAARRVITGGSAQVERLKGTLLRWLDDLFAGTYDAPYVITRWKIGLRHVEIGLDQVYTNTALSRLRCGLIQVLSTSMLDDGQLAAGILSLSKLLDLDLAIIEDAYQAEFQRRQEQSNRLATIGQVAGGVAHEMRNPLNVIKTSIYYLLNARNLAPAKQAEHLARIERQVGLADGVVTALNDFAKLPVPEMRPLSALNCVQEALESIILPGTVELVLDGLDGAPRISGDGAQVRIVLGNLIRNAVDAMPEGGHLRVAARPQEDHLEIQVVDTGVGIALEDLERIMQPLYSTKARGIGLGLAITRAIVEKHGGRVSVASTLGQGTRFQVTFPIALVESE